MLKIFFYCYIIAMAKKQVKKRVIRKSKGLTKTEKTQVKKIANSVISTVAEDKYMNAQRYIGVVPVQSTVGGTRISVMGFSTSLTNTANGGQLHYGYNENSALEPMKEQKMLRPFVPATGSAQTDAYAVEGRECKPKSAQCKWRFSRDIGEMLKNLSGAGYNTQQLNPPLEVASNLPIICRMIRVSPKQTQTNVLCDPRLDLFLDNYNNATGVDTGTFDDTELLTYRINKRRYTVAQDKFFRIQNGLTVQWQRSILSHADAGVNSATRMVLQPSITNTNANCDKVITTHSRLTMKKHGSVFYDTPDYSQLEAPSSGHKREFTLLHFMYAGAETFLDENASANPTYPTDLKISASPIVKFTDV